MVFLEPWFLEVFALYCLLSRLQFFLLFRTKVTFSNRPYQGKYQLWSDTIFTFSVYLQKNLNLTTEV